MSRKHTLLLFLALFLLTAPLVLASTPDFNVVDNYNTEVVNNNNNIGDLVITAKSYIADEINFDNFSHHNAQQYDLVVWNGNDSIIITSPLNEETVLVTGSQYYLSTVGQYYYHSLINATKTGLVTSFTKNPNNITISNIQQPNGFEINFSKTNFVLINEEIIPTTIKIDDDVPTGNYNLSFDVNNKKIIKTFKVLENLDWEIINGTINDTYIAQSGDNIYAGSVLLENTGNKDVEISVAKTGDNKHLLIIPQQQTLYKKSQLLVEFSIQVPLSIKPGSDKINLSIIGGGKTESKIINITVIDAVKPTIQEINFSTDKAFTQNFISVVATDNNEVANVTLTYDGKTIFFDKDEQLFTKTINFNKLSRYLLNFCAIDFDGNKKCLEINKTFKQTKLIVGAETNIKLPSKKVSQYSKIYLFNITEVPTEGISVLLKDFVPTTITEFNDSYVVRVVDGDGAVKSFDKYNGKITLQNKGEIFLEIRSSEVADYTGILSFELPEYADEVSDINFVVSFKDYDVPENFVRPWNHDTDLICNVVDTGDIDTTKYECSFDAPISIRPDDIAVPTTISERKEFENKASEVEQQLNKNKKRAETIITFLIAAIIIISLLAYYFIVHYPYVRITRGHKLKYKYNKQGDQIYQTK